MTLLRELTEPPRSPVDFMRVLPDVCNEFQRDRNFLVLQDEVDKLWSTDIPDFDLSTVGSPPTSSAILGAVASAKWMDGTPHPTVLAKQGWDGLGGSISIRLPRTRPGDPNVDVGDAIAYILDDGAKAYAVSDYLDDPIGSIKMWALVGGIPRGWRTVSSFSGWMVEMFHIMGITRSFIFTGQGSDGGIKPQPIGGVTTNNSFTGITDPKGGPVEVSVSTDGVAISSMRGTGTALNADLDTEPTSLDVDLGGSASGYTSLTDNGATQSDGGDDVCLCMTWDGSHIHTLVGPSATYFFPGFPPETQPFYPTQTDIPVGPDIDEYGCHTHELVESSFDHSHDIPGTHDHQFSIDPHDHNIVPNPHDHPPSGHTHPTTEDPHSHGVSGVHSHPGEYSAHTHTVVGESHAHNFEAVVSGGGGVHWHGPGKPERKTLILIERYT